MDVRSAPNSSIAWLLLGGSVALSALAQVLMRAAMLDLRQLAAAGGGTVSWGDLAALLPVGAWLAASVLGYAASMLCWLLVLARHPLSFAYPLLGASYVLVYLTAVLWPRLGEQWSGPRAAGVLLVAVGVMLVTRTRGDTRRV